MRALLILLVVKILESSRFNLNDSSLLGVNGFEVTLDRPESFKLRVTGRR